MLRPLLAALCLLLAATATAAQQQPAPQQPPPDTKPARERHRVQEKEPPPPSGPWGPEEFGFTWHNPVWRGLVLTVGTYSGSGISMDGVPDGLAAFSDGVNPPVYERLEWDSESFRTTSFTAAVDLDMIRLSASVFYGSFDADAEFSRNDGVTVTTTPLPVDGDAYGFRFGVYWPALRYRDTLLEISAGPIATAGWHHQEVSGLPGQYLTRDAVDVLTGSFGPKASVRALFGNVEVELNAEYSYTTGTMHGWTKEFSAGVGIHF